MTPLSYRTIGGVTVLRDHVSLPYEAALASLATQLDTYPGVLLSSSFEFPGRYTRWDIGFVNPPLRLTSRGPRVTVEALNERGAVLLRMILPSLRSVDPRLTAGADAVHLGLHASKEPFAEEARSRQPSVFSVIRSLIECLGADADPHLGLYGAFGYDLVFGFEPMPLRLARADDQRDLVLYLPDEILLVDHMRQQTTLCRYEFEHAGQTTAGLPRITAPSPVTPPGAAPPHSHHAPSDHAPGEYAAMVERARDAFARGDMFEVVLGQVFADACTDAPSEVFRRLRAANPAPYGALMNLGQGEFLVAASPEMFVRVEGQRVETCPISGTIARGADAIEDAEQIRTLLNSPKEAAELTMCTDVDRNDKSRVCEPGSVKVIGRRQIEMYSRLIHTVDHVEGQLRPEFDALDAFLTHAWAVTVTGAPKRAAIAFIEAQERSARRWYGGAIGRVTFDGNMNTGLTLRTIRMQAGVAEVRAGATLLHDSDPASEEAECRLKASAMFTAIRGGRPAVAARRSAAGPHRRVLLIDHEDSFVHTLAGYFRAAGAEVETMRAGMARAALRQGRAADLVVLSPGPGRPAEFAMSETLDVLLRRGLPVFGVCLGLQGIAEHFGATLDVLDIPVHGRATEVGHTGRGLLAGLPERFNVGRYHSLHVRRETLPATLPITAETADGVVMAIQHASLPIAAVQFHPESVLTRPAGLGQTLIAAALDGLTAWRAAA